MAARTAERLVRQDLARQMNAWMAANRVRPEDLRARLPDYGPLQWAYLALKDAGCSVARDGQTYLVDGARLRQPDFIARAGLELARRGLVAPKPKRRARS